MANDHLSEKQIVEDRRNDRAIFIAIGSFCVMLATAVALLFAGRAQFISMALVNLAVVTLLAGWLLFVFVSTRPGMLLSHESPDDYMSRNADVQHRRWRYQIVSALWSLCLSDGLLTQAIFQTSSLHARNLSFGLLLVSWAFAFVALLAVLTVAFGPGFYSSFYRRVLRDELVRAQQAKSVQFGYLFAIIEMCAVIVLAAYRPQWVIAILPSVVTIAIVLPGIYYLVLRRRADCDE